MKEANVPGKKEKSTVTKEEKMVPQEWTAFSH